MIGYILNYLREEIDKLINRPSNTNTYSNNKFSKYDIDEETYIAFIA